MDRVERIPYINGNINPIRVLIQGGTDGMGDKLKA